MGDATRSQPFHLQVAAALIRRGDDVLLVQQQGPDDPEPLWALPGGVMEVGEFPTEAMVREVREETGLTVTDPGRLLYVNVGTIPDGTKQPTVFVFAVAAWCGDIAPDDPDTFVTVAEFFPVAEAIARLELLPWPTMREPIVAHLRGEVPPGTLWLFHEEADGATTLVGRVPGVTGTHIEP